MHQIEVDFEVLKALMARRATEDVSNNDVIRGLLGIGSRPASTAETSTPGGDWRVKGVGFARGTEFRARHNGRQYLGRVEDGALVVDGRRHHSPSAAAAQITGYAINGWKFWECRAPGGDWRPMSSFRG